MFCARCRAFRSTVDPIAGRRTPRTREFLSEVWAGPPPAARWCLKTDCLWSMPSAAGSIGIACLGSSISNVEVFRGGASNLYGSDALGGVVQFITRQPLAPAFALETSYGNERTPDLSFWTGTRAGKWDLSLASEMFRTDGFIHRADLAARHRRCRRKFERRERRIDHRPSNRGKRPHLCSRNLLHRVPQQRHSHPDQ